MRWSAGLPALAAAASFAAVVAAARLAELLIGTARWRAADLALWVVALWAGLLLADRTYKRLAR